MFVDTKGTQKGLIFLYEMLRAAIASLKTCSMMQKQLTQKSATNCLKNAEWILVLYSRYFGSQKDSKRYILCNHSISTNYWHRDSATAILCLIITQKKPKQLPVESACWRWAFLNSGYSTTHANHKDRNVSRNNTFHAALIA